MDAASVPTADVKLLVASLIAMIAAFAVGGVDGLLFHLQRFRLFAHAESRFEHVLHTGRALLAIPVVVFLYLFEPVGIALYAALAAALADQVLMVIDLVVERRSRLRFGGLPHGEYMVHITANSLHAVAFALAFASVPASGWSVTADCSRSTLPAFLQWVAVGMVAAAVIATCQHVVLLCKNLRLARAPVAGATGQPGTP
jgi:hypothetical protein